MNPPQIPEQQQPEVSADVIAQLQFDFLKQIATLGLASAGGSLTLLQTVFANAENKFMIIAGMAALFLAALASLEAQQVMVERLGEATRTLRPHYTAVEKFRTPRTARAEKLLTIAASGLLGLGLALVVIFGIVIRSKIA
jgi:hypothetical protein